MEESPATSPGRSDPTIMQCAPLFPVAVGVLLGQTVDAYLPIPIFVSVVLLAIASIVLVGRRTTGYGTFLLLVASIAAGGMLHASFVRTLPTDAIARLTASENRIIRVRGTVDSEPRQFGGETSEFSAWAFSGARSTFVLRVDGIEGDHGWNPVSGRVQVFVREALLDLTEGERVEMLGWLELLRPPRNPGAFDWAAYSKRQGIEAGMTVNHREGIRRMAHAESRGWGFLIRSLRERARHMLVSDIAPDSAQQRSLLEAMVIGHRSRVDRKLNEMFIAAGCVHFLAVSGVHVLIVMFIARTVCAIISVLRILSGGPALRDATRAWFLLIAVVLYMLVAEPRPPILRAGIIAITYCVARILGRESARLNWISLAVIILSIIDPGIVFDIGFQLSTVAVLGVCYLAPAIADSIRLLNQRFRRHPAIEDMLGHDAAGSDSDRTDFQLAQRLDVLWQRLADWIKQALFVAIAAWIVTLPIVVHHFARVHPWGAINSLVVLPVVSLVMAVGFAKLILSMVFPSISVHLAGPLEALDTFLIYGVEQLSRLPGASVDLVAQPIYVTVALYALLITFVLFVRARGERPLATLGILSIPLLSRAAGFSLRDAPNDVHRVEPKESTPQNDPSPTVPAWIPVSATALLLVAIFAWRIGLTHGDRLTVTALAVGAGSATVIELPEGQTTLYDCGSMANPDVGRRVIVPYLRSRGIRRIDRVYVSHPNVDHFNGLPGVIEQVSTGPVFVNHLFEPLCSPRSPSRHLLKLMDKANHEVAVLDGSVKEWHYGGAIFELLWPPIESPEDLPANDSSTVLRISYAGRSILLTGDIEQQAQDALLAGRNLHADVLVLPHHGGVEGNTQAFIEAVDPEILIRSSHQTLNETASGLPNIIGDRRLLNTADHGAITIEFDDNGIQTTSFLPDR